MTSMQKVDLRSDFDYHLSRAAVAWRNTKFDILSGYQEKTRKLLTCRVKI